LRASRLGHWHAGGTQVCGWVGVKSLMGMTWSRQQFLLKVSMDVRLQNSEISSVFNAIISA